MKYPDCIVCGVESSEQMDAFVIVKQERDQLKADLAKARELIGRMRDEIVTYCENVNCEGNCDICPRKKLIAESEEVLK